MSADSKIEWTDATWNIVTGCTKVSPGCDHCYAERLTERFHGKGSFAEVVLHPERLDLPNRWRKPRRVFVNSMSDLFHKDVPNKFIATGWSAMAGNPRHTFQVLTKRPARARAFLRRCARCEHGWWTHDGTNPAGAYEGSGIIVASGDAWPPPNVWLGTSVEDQKRADQRIPILVDTPAAVRFLSCEPLIAPVDLTRVASGMRDDVVFDVLGRRYDVPGQWQAPMSHGIDWVIVGGESGTGARPIREEWVRSLVQQCQAARVPVFVKQMGAVWASEHGVPGKGGDMSQWPEDLRVREFPVATS